MPLQSASQLPRRRVILGGLFLLALFLTLVASRRKHSQEPLRKNVPAMIVEEIPFGDQSAPERHRYPPPGRPSFKTNTTPEKPKWDKSRAVKGKPTSHLRGNLRPDKKYVTTWNYGGMTNEVFVWMNAIHLGLISDRIPILFPLIGCEVQVGVGAETLSAGSFFDLPRLSEAIGHPVLDWQDVKKGRFDRAFHETDYSFHNDDELLGCWSVVQTFDDSKKPLNREGPHFLHLGEIFAALFEPLL